MAFKIDKKESAVGSLDEMRIQVVFEDTNGQKISTGIDAATSGDSLWVADSIGDLPCVGDHLLLPNTTKNDDTSTTQNSYKVTARYIDLNGFIKNGERVICTIKLESGGTL